MLDDTVGERGGQYRSGKAKPIGWEVVPLELIANCHMDGKNFWCQFGGYSLAPRDARIGTYIDDVETMPVVRVDQLVQFDRKYRHPGSPQAPTGPVSVVTNNVILRLLELLRPGQGAHLSNGVKSLAIPSFIFP
ncbi:MAG: hypothetical protein E5V16_12450 [Mesorhizobium sp.]|nr:MAG: hypothetical protein E5V16_12450 [Mesorhizobium sp.]